LSENEIQDLGKLFR